MGLLPKCLMSCSTKLYALDRSPRKPHALEATYREILQNVYPCSRIHRLASSEVIEFGCPGASVFCAIIPDAVAFAGRPFGMAPFEIGTCTCRTGAAGTPPLTFTD